MFYCTFYFTCDRSLNDVGELELESDLTYLKVLIGCRVASQLWCCQRRCTSQLFATISTAAAAAVAAAAVT